MEYYESENSIVTQKIYAFIGIGALMMFNVISIIGIIETGLNVNILKYLYTNDRLLNRIVIIPLLISPIFIALFIVYKKNHEKISIYFDYFENMTISEKKKYNIYFLLYISISVLFLLLSVTSPLWLKAIN